MPGAGCSAGQHTPEANALRSGTRDVSTGAASSDVALPGPAGRQEGSVTGQRHETGHARFRGAWIFFMALIRSWRAYK